MVPGFPAGEQRTSGPPKPPPGGSCEPPGSPVPAELSPIISHVVKYWQSVEGHDTLVGPSRRTRVNCEISIWVLVYLFICVSRDTLGVSVLTHSRPPPSYADASHRPNFPPPIHRTECVHTACVRTHRLCTQAWTAHHLPRSGRHTPHGSPDKRRRVPNTLHMIAHNSPCRPPWTPACLSPGAGPGGPGRV